jgi:hypothetical protein
MTDDSNLTPGGEMNETSVVTVRIRDDDEGHWVDWIKNGENGSLGPYQDREMAENVRNSKERELAENVGHIDDAG